MFLPRVRYSERSRPTSLSKSLFCGGAALYRPYCQKIKTIGKARFLSQLGVASPRVVRYVILSVCPVVMSPVAREATTSVTIGAAVSIFKRAKKIV